MSGDYPVVVIEGIDGSGKTTLRNYVWDALLEANVPTIAMGQHCWLDVDAARLLIGLRTPESPQTEDLDPRAIRQAYLDDKMLHWENSIGPACESAVVLLDRYTMSDAVYLEAIYGLDRQETLYEAARRGIGVPEVLVYLDIDATHAERRVIERGRETRHYEEAVALGRLRESYHRVLDEGREPGTLFTRELLELRSRNSGELRHSGEIVLNRVLALLPSLS